MQARIDRRDILPCVVIAAFCLYLFRDILLAGHHLGGVDFIQFYLAMKKFFFEELQAHHSIPLWNPYIFSGMPFLAHFESTVFYPLGFLFWFVPPEEAYGFTMFGHVALAGVFMYLLARSFGLGRTGSFFAGAMFSCNGFLMAILYLGHLSPVMSYVWLPAVIFFLHRALFSEKPVLYASVAGVCWSSQILAGAPQDAFYTFLASMLFLALHTPVNLKGGQRCIRPALIASFLFLIGAGMAAVQLVPAFELIGESVRASLDSYEMTTKASYPLEGIVTAILPNFFGSYARSDFWVHSVPWSIPHQNLYVGVLPLCMLCFLSYRHAECRKAMVFSAVAALMALLLALGHHTPFYKFFYLLPGFDRFRAPSKIIVLWVFGLGLLAATSVDQVLKNRTSLPPRRLVVLAAAAGLLLMLDIAFTIHHSLVLKLFAPFILKEAIPARMADAVGIIRSEFHRLTILALCGVLILLILKRGLFHRLGGSALMCTLLLGDLAYVHGPSIIPRDEVYRSMGMIKRALDATLGQDKSVYRVGSFVHPLGGNLEMVLGYQSVNGFTALFPARYYEYCTRFAENQIPEGWVTFFYGATGNPLFMDLLNVKYEISYESRSYGERDTWLPRAFVVPACKKLRKEKVLDGMTKPDFDPKKRVIFEEEDPSPSFADQLAPAERFSSSAQVTSYRPDEIMVKVESSAPGFLFLSEMFYPGWKTWVNGKEKEILRGNYLFRVVEIPRGTSEVRLVFDPFSLKVGMALTLLSCFMVGAILWHGIYRTRHS